MYLIVTAGLQTGQRLEAAPVSEAGEGGGRAGGHHAQEVRGGGARRGAAVRVTLLVQVLCFIFTVSQSEEPFLC